MDPHEMPHRRRVDEFEALPFFHMTTRNLAYGGLALVIAAGSMVAVGMSNMDRLVQAVGSFAIMGISGPLVVAGFVKPRGGFSSFEEKAFLYAKWYLKNGKTCFESDTVFDREEDREKDAFNKRARKNARRERERRGH